MLYYSLRDLDGSGEDNMGRGYGIVSWIIVLQHLCLCLGIVSMFSEVCYYFLSL